MAQKSTREGRASQEGFTDWVERTWRKNGSVVLMYASSALGALSKSFFDAAVAGTEFSLTTGNVVFAFVVSAVIFPLIYEAVRKTWKVQEEPTLLVYFTAYQNGFFWQSLLMLTGAVVS